MIVFVVSDVLSNIDVMVLLFIVLLANTIFDWAFIVIVTRDLSN